MLLLTAVAAILAVVLLNLSWFDEPLLPELEALRKPMPATLEANAFVFALGFQAEEGRDPRAAGNEIIGILQARRDRGEPATVGKEEKLPSSACRCHWMLSVPSHARKRRLPQGRSRSARLACLDTAWIARSD